MTNPPADLLGLRARVQARTGLTATDVGIVGDPAHAATGGYHEGRTDLANAGVLGSDYSVRLPRDKAGLTESASAMDIGANWSTGRPAWLRFNNLLVQQLHAGDPALAAVRATNYSPDGTTRLRTDREAGWTTVSSTDVVDVHTHIEWYRDTEGKRQASLDRIDALIAAAIANQPPEDDMPFLDDPNAAALAYRMDALESGSDTVRGGPTKGEPMWLVTAVKDLQAKVGQPAPVALTDADWNAIADEVAAQLRGELDEVKTAVNDLVARLAAAGNALDG